MKNFNGEEIIDSIYNILEFEPLQKLIIDEVNSYSDDKFGNSSSYESRNDLIKNLCKMRISIDPATGVEKIHPKFITDVRTNGNKYKLWIKCYEKYRLSFCHK